MLSHEQPADMMMETSAPGLHDALLLGIGIASVYLVVAGLQLVQLKRRQPQQATIREPSVGQPLTLDQSGKTAKSPPSFSSHLERSGIEAELRRVKRNLERMETELGDMRDEVRQLRSHRSVASVGPQYNEAMVFARQGVDATGIAARCNISRSEAELVASLARRSKEAISTNEQHGQTNIEPDERKRYRVAA